MTQLPILSAKKLLLKFWRMLALGLLGKEEAYVFAFRVSEGNQ